MKKRVNLSRRRFVYQLSTASLLLPLSRLPSILTQEDYHFAQPNHPAPEFLCHPPNANDFGGFQSVGWNVQNAHVVSQANHVEATLTNGVGELINNNITTVQFMYWWGDGPIINANNSIKAWDGSLYGYNVNEVKVSFGAMVKIPTSTGNSANYSTFYLRGIEIVSGIKYWLQFSLFDSRGPLPDAFYYDVGLTNELAFTGQLGNSSYFSLNPDSHPVQHTPFSDLRFFGAKVSRQQLFNIMEEFKNQYPAVNISSEPNLHHIYSFGFTPEIGLASMGGSMSFVAENAFLRTEYP